MLMQALHRTRQGEGGLAAVIVEVEDAAVEEMEEEEEVVVVVAAVAAEHDVMGRWCIRTHEG